MYINRQIDKELLKWREETDHKPILLRGARQGWKTLNLLKKYKQRVPELRISAAFEAVVHQSGGKLVEQYTNKQKSPQSFTGGGTLKAIGLGITMFLSTFGLKAQNVVHAVIVSP